MPWPKGVSGNPGGRPRGLAEVSRLARAYTSEAIDTLAKCMREGEPRARIAAAEALLNRGWGRSAPPGEEEVDAGPSAEKEVLIDRLLVALRQGANSGPQT